MGKMEELKEFILHYWQLSNPSIDWTMQFNSKHLNNFSSLRMLRFLAGIEERFKISIENVDAVRTFEDLLQLVKNS